MDPMEEEPAEGHDLKHEPPPRANFGEIDASRVKDVAAAISAGIAAGNVELAGEDAETMEMAVVCPQYRTMSSPASSPSCSHVFNFTSHVFLPFTSTHPRAEYLTYRVPVVTPALSCICLNLYHRSEPVLVSPPGSQPPSFSSLCLTLRMACEAS